MAVLSVNDRQNIHADIMRKLSAIREPLPLTKPELLEAINAVDDWIDSNTASFNNALPVAARTALSAKQKERLFMLVAEKRFEVL